MSGTHKKPDSSGPWGQVALRSALSYLGKLVAPLNWRNRSGHPEANPQLTAEPDARAPSVAVLPFEDTSENSDQMYFCEGLAEEILDALRRAGEVRTISRQVAFRVGDQHRSGVTEIARKLKVSAVLRGSVYKSSGQLRVDAQLVDAGNGMPLWSQVFGREPQHAFDIQQEIAAAIPRALGLDSNSLRDAGPRPDPKAYDYFLRGLSCFARHTTQDNLYARQLFARAIELEPEYGRAWAGIAYTYAFEYMYFNASDVNRAEALRTSDKALELAPGLAESHVSAGIAHCMNNEYQRAESEFTAAVQLDPRSYEAWYFFGRSKVHEGDLARALRLFNQAARVRPEDFQSVLLQAQLYTSLGRKDKAAEVTSIGIERVRAILQLNPGDNRALNMGAFALLRQGQKEEAARWMTASMNNAPLDSIIQYNAACFFSLAGEAGRALDCLENCLVKVGNINREWLDHDSDLDPVRQHPRFAQIIRSFPE